MMDTTFTPGEMAQVHLRIYRIQQAARSGRDTYIFNQARLLLLLVQKVERREVKARRQQNEP